MNSLKVETGVRGHLRQEIVAKHRSDCDTPRVVVSWWLAGSLAKGRYGMADPMRQARILDHTGRMRKDESEM
jgi:hypothetical protein